MSRLRRRRVSQDGAFWGGILLLVTWGTAMSLVLLAVTGKLPASGV
ncbi:hypothetical protein [Streptomyces sp. NPDC059063]